ncbi:mechanosensitive ion channel family protein, partial [Aliidiomarina sp.]|uniref:mechanosensitive ion channel family protein n=1 Tax=Aliidiomarina sp. TaxID=1872439 RepID=UPI003A4DFE34
GWLEQHPQLYLATGLFILFILAWLSNAVVKRMLVRGIMKALRTTEIGRTHEIAKSSVIARLANVIPALVLSVGIVWVPEVPEVVVAVIQNVANAFVILTVALAINGALTLINTIYEKKPDSHLKPIKGYIQVIKIVIYLVSAILIIAALIDRSPVILLSGIGAMAAVLMLVFQDTLLSLVASMQISSNDIVRVGDWVEMPALNADGDVIDIALHTVKVQNWDKTITTIPTRRFITDSFKNWRGMQDSGGRRIMRNILLDQQSIGFLSDEDKTRLSRFRLLREYLESKQKEIDDWNQSLKDEGKEPANTRRITNIGTFRAYILNYLKHHQRIHQDMTMMVRQLAPTSDGLPLQVYGFTNTTAWVDYEAIQSDLFDHLLSILPEFGLRVYQHPSGVDLRSLRDTSVKTTVPEDKPD